MDEIQNSDKILVNKQTFDDLCHEAAKIKIGVSEVFEEFNEEINRREKQNQDEKTNADEDHWKALQRELESGKYTVVYKADIERLITEAMQIREFLPKVLKKDYFTAYTKLENIETELTQLKREKKKLVAEIERMRNKHQAILSELEGERTEIAALRKNCDEVNEINSQQSDYCSRMGAASCTLLWRISQRDECVETLLSGTQTEEFLQLVCHTLESYSLTISESEVSSFDDSSSELQFVLALCGVGTNIAASTYGREFLMTNSIGTMLVQSLVAALCQMEPVMKQGLKIRNLCLKFLYNISINQKGVKYLSKKHEFLETLTGIIEGDISLENRLLAVRLIQSLMLEAENMHLVHQVEGMLPVDKLRNIAVNVHGELQEALLELIKDLKFFQREA